MMLVDNEVSAIVALRWKGANLFLYRRGDRGLPRRLRARGIAIGYIKTDRRARGFWRCFD
jgi:hypothetical protein